MKTKSTNSLRDALAAAAVGALVLGLGACEPEPQAYGPGKTSDSLVEDAGRDLRSAPSPAPPVLAVGEAGFRPSPAAPAVDAALEARVKAAISADPGLRSVSVDVKSADGVVTLYGTADSPAKSHQAAMIAMNVDGVRSVRNEMVVLRGS
jgi:hypothetical protein